MVGKLFQQEIAITQQAVYFYPFLYTLPKGFLYMQYQIPDIVNILPTSYI